MNTLSRESIPRIKPPDFVREACQPFDLFLLALGRGFQNPILDRLENIAAIRFQPTQNIRRQLAVMGAGFHNLLAVAGPLAEPIDELNREQCPEQIADADAGKEVAALPRRCLRTLVVSKIGTVQRQLHEAPKRYKSSLCHFFPYDCAHITHCKPVPPFSGHDSC